MFSFLWVANSHFPNTLVYKWKVFENKGNIFFLMGWDLYPFFKVDTISQKDYNSRLNEFYNHIKENFKINWCYILKIEDNNPVKEKYLVDSDSFNYKVVFKCEKIWDKLEIHNTVFASYEKWYRNLINISVWELELWVRDFSDENIQIIDLYKKEMQKYRQVYHELNFEVYSLLYFAPCGRRSLWYIWTS